MIFCYVRVSTVEQADGTSLDEQERVTRHLSAIRGDSSPVVLRDAGISGSVPLIERPGGKSLMEQVTSGDVVICAKLDRMFRDTIDAFETAKRFKDLGVDLILMDISHEPVTGNGTGKLLFGIMAVYADFERERIKERADIGRKGKKARGGHIGGEPPYGYLIEGSGTEAMLRINPVEQGVIEIIRDAYSRIGTYNGVAVWLNDRGIRAREGIWYARQVLRIIQRDQGGHNGVVRRDVSQSAHAA